MRLLCRCTQRRTSFYYKQRSLLLLSDELCIETEQVYSTEDFKLLDKKSIKLPGVKEFSWSPSQNIIAAYIPGKKRPTKETYKRQKRPTIQCLLLLANTHRCLHSR